LPYKNKSEISQRSEISLDTGLPDADAGPPYISIKLTINRNY